MIKYPKIDTPCPYKNNLAAILDGDFCTMCERQVFDLSEMIEDERKTFLARCGEEVCVSYSMRPAIAATALAAAAMTVPTAAIAQDTGADAGFMSDMIIIVGGIKDPANTEFVENPEDASIPELPVTYEDEGAPSVSD